MIHPDGTPNVLEFNCRFGDPETQPILARMRSDLTSLCEAALDGKLEGVEVDWDPRAAVGVVMAAGGYPDEVRKGDEIRGLDAAAKMPGKVFHAGTALNAAGKVVTNGGRVLCAVRPGRHRARGAAAGLRTRGHDLLGRPAVPQGHRLSRDRAGVVAPASCSAACPARHSGVVASGRFGGIFPAWKGRHARGKNARSAACGTAPERVPGQARERRTAHRSAAEARGEPVFVNRRPGNAKANSQTELRVLARRPRLIHASTTAAACAR